MRAVFSNMILIDNGYGASLYVGLDGDDLWAVMKNMIFYGETEVSDCDQGRICTGSGW